MHYSFFVDLYSTSFSSSIGSASISARSAITLASGLFPSIIPTTPVVVITVKGIFSSVNFSCTNLLVSNSDNLILDGHVNNDELE
jgi:mRNA-degrading endonuclease toxin of MazEF toxin-antitoxin module